MHTDWTPEGGGADDGFRIWICAGSDDEANLFVKPVLDVASSLWEPMTLAEPDGMGKPVPDTVIGSTPHRGSSKIDILIVHTSDCSDRTCPLFSPDDPTGPFRLGVEQTIRDSCHVPGYPSRGCSGYLTLNAGVICPDAAVCTNAALKGVFAHEFFHLLQDAHNADVFSRVAFKVGSRVTLEKNWYSEASAEWAAWYYAKDPDAYPYFVNAFQPNNDSLLAFGQGHEYGSWVWPLLMQREIGASAVFTSWHDAEQAATPQGLDDAVDHTMAFADHFRDLSVSNLNPNEYFDGAGVGLEDEVWQTQVGDFPKNAHVHDSAGAINLGDQSVFVDVAPLAADDTEFTIPATVRQVTIDVSSVAHADTADIDVVGRLARAPGHASDPPAWRRIRGGRSTLMFCRDNPNENFDLAYVVLSNHARTRAPLGGPASDAAVKGVYNVKAKNACAAPDHYDATFTGFSAVGDSWSGTATFDLIGAGSTCDPLTPPAPNDLSYCYRSVDGNAQWKYTDPNGATYNASVRLLPSTDSGFIELRMQTGDPNYDGSYKAGILPLSRAHLMPVAGGQRDAADSVLAWTGAPDASIGNPPKIGSGFQLAGTFRGCAEGACQGWTWNYTPRWN
jgi:hypothetical protein